MRPDRCGIKYRFAFLCIELFNIWSQYGKEHVNVSQCNKLLFTHSAVIQNSILIKNFLHDKCVLISVIIDQENKHIYIRVAIAGFGVMSKLCVLVLPPIPLLRVFLIRAYSLMWNDFDVMLHSNEI